MSMRFTSSAGKKPGFLIAGVLGAVFVLAAVWFDDFARRNLEDNLHRQASALVQQHALTRSCNAAFGDVYVRKQPGIETNKYLYQVGPGQGTPSSVVPEITDRQGNIYTLMSPTLMTRETSEQAAKQTSIRFRLTSLKTINPKNAPDAFETASLRQFEAGTRGTSEFVRNEGKHTFRYMAPLFIEQRCLACHGFQGYKIGDVRGGISVALPADDELSRMNTSRQQFIFGSGTLLILAVTAIMLGLRYVGVRPPEQEGNTDALTGLYNRRYLFSEGARLYERWRRDGVGIAVLLIDIDHFKLVNDKFGHQVGDDVLVAVTQILMKQCRPYDLVARYGGEEFLVMMEASSYGSGNSSAQRILQSISEHVFQSGVIELRITVSIGVVEGSSLGDLDSTLCKADEALSQAKNAGRNRIVAHNENEL